MIHYGLKLSQNETEKRDITEVIDENPHSSLLRWTFGLRCDV
jgi:hypothetical protein